MTRRKTKAGNKTADERAQRHAKARLELIEERAAAGRAKPTFWESARAWAKTTAMSKEKLRQADELLDNLKLEKSARNRTNSAAVLKFTSNRTNISEEAQGNIQIYSNYNSRVFYVRVQDAEELAFLARELPSLRRQFGRRLNDLHSWVKANKILKAAGKKPDRPVIHSTIGYNSQLEQIFDDFTALAASHSKTAREFVETMQRAMPVATLLPSGPAELFLSLQGSERLDAEQFAEVVSRLSLEGKSQSAVIASALGKTASPEQLLEWTNALEELKEYLQLFPKSVDERNWPAIFRALNELRPARTIEDVRIWLDRMFDIEAGNRALALVYLQLLYRIAGEQAEDADFIKTRRSKRAEEKPPEVPQASFLQRMRYTNQDVEKEDHARRELERAKEQADDKRRREEVRESRALSGAKDQALAEFKKLCELFKEFNTSNSSLLGFFMDERVHKALSEGQALAAKPSPLGTRKLFWEAMLKWLAKAPDAFTGDNSWVERAVETLKRLPEDAPTLLYLTLQDSMPLKNPENDSVDARLKAIETLARAVSKPLKPTPARDAERTLAALASLNACTPEQLEWAREFVRTRGRLAEQALEQVIEQVTREDAWESKYQKTRLSLRTTEPLPDYAEKIFTPLAWEEQKTQAKTFLSLAKFVPAEQVAWAREFVDEHGEQAKLVLNFILKCAENGMRPLLLAEGLQRVAEATLETRFIQSERDIYPLSDAWWAFSSVEAIPAIARVLEETRDKPRESIEEITAYLQRYGRTAFERGEQRENPTQVRAVQLAQKIYSAKVQENPQCLKQFIQAFSKAIEQSGLKAEGFAPLAEQFIPKQQHAKEASIEQKMLALARDLKAIEPLYERFSFWFNQGPGYHILATAFLHVAPELEEKQLREHGGTTESPFVQAVRELVKAEQATRLPPGFLTELAFKADSKPPENWRELPVAIAHFASKLEPEINSANCGNYAIGDALSLAFPKQENKLLVMNENAEAAATIINRTSKLEFNSGQIRSALQTVFDSKALQSDSNALSRAVAVCDALEQAATLKCTPGESLNTVQECVKTNVTENLKHHVECYVLVQRKLALMPEPKIQEFAKETLLPTIALHAGNDSFRAALGKHCFSRTACTAKDVEAAVPSMQRLNLQEQAAKLEESISKQEEQGKTAEGARKRLSELKMQISQLPETPAREPRGFEWTRERLDFARQTIKAQKDIALATVAARLNKAMPVSSVNVVAFIPVLEAAFDGKGTPLNAQTITDAASFLSKKAVKSDRQFLLAVGRTACALARINTGPGPRTDDGKAVFAELMRFGAEVEGKNAKQLAPLVTALDAFAEFNDAKATTALAKKVEGREFQTPAQMLAFVQDENLRLSLKQLSITKEELKARGISEQDTKQFIGTPFYNVLAKLTACYESKKGDKQLLKEIVFHAFKGDFKEWRYANEVGAAQLEGLNEKQREAWVRAFEPTRKNMERLSEQELAASKAGVLTQALRDAAGYVKGVNFNEPAITQAEQQAEQLAQQLAPLEKGSDEALELEAKLDILKNQVVVAKGLNELRAIDYNQQFTEPQLAEIEEKTKAVQKAVLALGQPEPKDDLIHFLRTLRKPLEEFKSAHLQADDSDDLLTLLQIGEVPRHSCQSYASGSHNHCLLAYVGDANKKALIVRDETGKIRARAIMKLFTAKIDGQTKRVLLVEPLYADSTNSEYGRLIALHALRKANAVGAVLASTWIVDNREKEQPGEKRPVINLEGDLGKLGYIIHQKEATIVSPPSVNPWEYSDTYGVQDARHGYSRKVTLNFIEHIPRRELAQAYAKRGEELPQLVIKVWSSPEQASAF